MSRRLDSDRLSENKENVFVSLEGIDFTGKTTIVRRLGKELRSLGIDPVLIADPPLMSPWKDIKRELLDRRNPMAAPAEALIYLAGRVDNVVRIIQPALGKGRVIVADRFNDSWIAYWAPELKGAIGSLESAMSWLSRFDAELRSKGMGALPTRTYLLLDDPRVASQRSPGKVRTKWEKVRTLTEVQEVYVRLAKLHPKRFKVFDIREEGLKATTDRVVDEAIHYISEEIGP